MCAWLTRLAARLLLAEPAFCLREAEATAPVRPPAALLGLRRRTLLLPPGQIFLGKVNFRKLCAAKRIDARPRNLLKSFKFGESSIQFRAHLSKMVICAGVLAADRTGINFLLDERHQTNASRQRS